MPSTATPIAKPSNPRPCTPEPGIHCPDGLLESDRVEGVHVKIARGLDETVGEAWALLQTIQRDAGVSMAPNRSWIVATALAFGLPLVTRDDRDELPGLEIILV